jgi:nucleoside 2-deoxyribosyltransferase
VAIKPFAFILMPFDEAFTDTYKLGIKAVSDELGVVAERVDEQSFSETILERIYRQIQIADFIVADMTGRNANVFYEVGYAHALEKRCILITRHADDIPFDLKHHRHIIYGNSISNLKAKLRDEFKWMMKEIEKSKTSPISIELKSSYGDLTASDSFANATVDFVFDLRNMSKRKSPDIDGIYFHIGKTWKVEQDDEPCASTESNYEDNLRHFVKSPVQRLSPGGWAQIKLRAKKMVWNRWGGEELKDKYSFSGNVYLEISTAEGTFAETMKVSADCEEVPF